MTRVHAEAWPDVDGGHPLVLCAGTVCVAPVPRARGGGVADPEGHQIELTTYRDVSASG